VIPTAYVLVLLSLAAFRSWRLVGVDVITRPVRQRLIRRAEEPDMIYVGPGAYRPLLDELVGCPWCLGAWISVGWWVAWTIWPHGTIVAAVPFAISALVGLVGSRLDA